MSDVFSNLTYPLARYAIPPAGLLPEWETVYNALRVPACTVAANREHYVRCGERRGDRSLLKTWYDTVTRCWEGAAAVMPYLSGRAERTERMALAIEAAIGPFRNALAVAVCTPPPPLPRRLWPKSLDDRQARDAAQGAWAEETARRQWADLGVVKEFDGRSLLDELCKAVTAENDARVRLGSLAQDLTVDRLGRVTIYNDRGVQLGLSLDAENGLNPTAQPTATTATAPLPEPASGGDDPTAYRPAKEFLDPERFPDYKAIHKALKANPRIRTRSPTRQRLVIHAGDWQAMLSQHNPIDPVDLPAGTVDAAVKVGEQRKAAVRNARR